MAEYEDGKSRRLQEMRMDRQVHLTSYPHWWKMINGKSMRCRFQFWKDIRIVFGVLLFPGHSNLFLRLRRQILRLKYGIREVIQDLLYEPRSGILQTMRRGNGIRRVLIGIGTADVFSLDGRMRVLRCGMWSGEQQP